MERMRLDETLLRKRTLLLTGEITKERINVLRNLLLFLNSLSKKEIKLIIDTPGGDVIAALKFCDAISLSSAPITCIIDGECSSSGIVILQAAHKRLMTSHSFIYLHPIAISFEKEQFAIDEKTEERIIDRVRGTRRRQKFIYDAIIKRTGLTEEKIREKEGKIIFAKEAKEMNLIDKVIEKYKI